MINLLGFWLVVFDFILAIEGLKELNGMRMKKVFLDEEPVTFSEGLPQDIATLLAVLTQHLEASNRFVAELFVDNVDVLNVFCGEVPSVFSTIRAVSAPQDEFMERVIAARVPFIGGLIPLFEEISAQILIKPWKVSVGELNGAVQKLSIITEITEELKDFLEGKYTSWKLDFESLDDEFQELLGQFLDSFEAKDIAGLSEQLYHKWPELIQRFMNCLQGFVIPYFKSLKIAKN